MSSLRFARLFIFLACLAGAGWVAGLVGFTAEVHDYNEPAITDTLAAKDAIIVLTGGSERLNRGFDLLAAQKGHKLFISGVHPKLTLDHVLAKHEIPQDIKDCCIILGHAADNTVGNVEETGSWVDNENFHSFYLVTANYHMPRSLFLFHDALPDIEIVPFPVTPDNVKLSEWWAWPGTLSLLVTEYNKYIWATTRVYLRNWLEDIVEDLS